MDRKEIESNYSRAIRFAVKGRIKDAFTLTRRLTRETDDALLMSEIEQLEGNYQKVTEYAFKGVDDPERKKVMQQIIRGLMSLADSARFRLVKPYIERKIPEKGNPVVLNDESAAEQLLEEVSFSKEVSNVLEGAAPSDDTHTVEDFFYHFLLKESLSSAEIYFLEKLGGSEAFAWYEKSMIVSALTISLFNCFDEGKFKSLFTFYKQGEDKVWHRALVGLVLAMYLYDQRISLYPGVKGVRFQLGDSELNDKDIESIILQLNRSKDTEKVTRKMQEEIIPEMIKLKPKIEDKLSLEELLKEDTEDDKNPKWETFFKDTPGLADKMEEFSRMQMEGADVFMSAFSMLKQFSFFDKTVNWFKPFYATEEHATEAMANEEVSVDKEKFLEGIENSAFLCNSDKYSFLLNVKQMPQAQKQTMFQMLQMELEQMNEVASQDQMIDDNSKNKTIYVRYIQDLYRFFKLNQLKDEFGDIFSYKMDVHNTESFNAMVSDKNVVRNIAEFYFESEHFVDAVSIYENLVEQGANEPEIYEKLGYAYRKLERFEEALKNHQKAELFDSNRIWNLKQIGFCLRKLARADEAIKYYQDAERIAPDDLRLKAAIAYTHLQEKNYDEALKYYQELESAADSKPAAKRPVAWCALLLGKTDMARHYYNELISEKPSQYDYMNLGHVEWVDGNTEAAVDNYIKSIRTEGNSLKKFLIGFEDDKKHLIANGVSADLIPLVIDQMRYLLQKS